MKIGNNYIGHPDVVGSNEITYVDAEGNGKFVDNTRYTIKIKVFLKGENGSTLTYFPKYGVDALSAYSFLYRADGGDQFSDEIQDPVNPELYEPVCKIVNDTLIEGIAGSDILVKAPIHFANSNDTRTPSNLTFTFDEVNNYEGTENDSENVDQLSYYSVNVLYDASGNYTLPQTTENHLTNDKGYYVNVMAIYSDGYTVSKTFYLILHVIERPVVQSVVAYGLASDQSDADDRLISSVMNVYMNPYLSNQVNLPSSTNTVTFNLSQGGVVMYNAVLPIITDASSNPILYTILKADLVQVWTTTAPTQESNGSYQYDVTANILHYTLYENEFTPRVSEAVTRTFTSDIVPLPSVVALNAWVAASNVAGTGHRTVDISNATTADGYNLAPELGIVGKFSKNDFYGSGITSGFFKDLDAVDASGNAVTNHKFTVSVNGTSKTVTTLHQIQGHSDKSDQELYIEMFESVKNGPAVSNINGVETILTELELQTIKADSNPIISVNNNESGWSIVNTGPNTNGATGGRLPKVNLYFYGNTTAAADQTASNAFTLNQANGLGMYAVFHQNAGANKYPALYTYTTPTSSGGVNKTSWYKSRIVYASINDNAGDTLADQNKVGLTLIYTGTDDVNAFSHIPPSRRVKYEIKYGTNLTNSNSAENAFSQELVNMLALMTSSVALPDVNAGSYNFRLLETGIFTSNSNFGELILRYNVLSRLYTSENGSFRNLPGPAGVLGSAQKPIYFWIPSTDLFNQTDSVKVSIAIEPRAGETTRPSATESDAQIIVAKVNKYVMTVGTASEPEFKDGTLTVPINNASTVANEYYFESAIFTSDNAAPNDVKEVSSSNGGVFNILVVNPSIRGANCNYQVRYKITDPNAENGSITGPISATYSIALFNEPGLDNFNVTNFSYETFNNNAVSKFKFDIQFLTVDSRTVDGVYVYFKSTNNDEDDSNDIPLTELMVVSKTTGETQTNLSYTLQNTAAANASISEGVKIVDKLGADSINKWLNFRSGEIVFKPYKGSTVQSVQTARTVYNVPSIPMPTNLTLAGGVKESYDATRGAWDNALNTYASISSAVTASYKLVLNTTDVSGQVANDGYTIDLSSYAAGDAVTLTLQVKITTAIDSLSYLSNSAVLDFVVASVNTSGLSTIVVKRGSNQSTLKVTRGDSVIAPLNGATVTEVKLIDNVNPANTNPTDASVKVLTCSSTQADVQPADPTVNDYNLVTDGYVLGDDVDMQYRAKASVSYNVKYGSAAAVPLSSTPLYLSLQAAEVKYVVATNPDTLIGSSYRTESSGTYAGRIAVNVNINANGLHAEGLQSAVFILAQEGDVTNSAVSEEGVQIVAAFKSSDGLTKSYIVGPNASLLPSSTDNLGATEVQQVNVTGVSGLVGGSATVHTLVMGNLLSSDQSTLYLDANSGFNITLPITVIAIVSTRLGTDILFKEMTPSA